MNAEELAQRFHEAYERLAPSFGYETRKASAKPWPEVPENNRRLMTAVCAEVMAASNREKDAEIQRLTGLVEMAKMFMPRGHQLIVDVATIKAKDAEIARLKEQCDALQESKSAGYAMHARGMDERDALKAEIARLKESVADYKSSMSAANADVKP